MNMKQTIFLMLLLAMTMSACGPSQQITGSWVNHEALPKGPYKSIFILAITQDRKANYAVEDNVAQLLISRGIKVVKSNDIFPPKFSATNDITKEQMAQAIKEAGCDGVFTIALLDTKTEQRYQPGTTYSPISIGFYGSYYGYYNYYYPQVYSPGYYTTDKTYYIESNFFDLASDLLLWSIQSQAYNPSSFDSWFHGYSQLMLKKLNSEGLIRKK
jgi:hypothetical protein